MTIPTLIALLTAVSGVVGVVMLVLRHPREQALSLTQQTQAMLESMRIIIDELEEALERCRAERARLQAQLGDDPDDEDH